MLSNVCERNMVEVVKNQTEMWASVLHLQFRASPEERYMHLTKSAKVSLAQNKNRQK